MQPAWESYQLATNSKKGVVSEALLWSIDATPNVDHVVFLDQSFPGVFFFFSFQTF